MQTGQLILRRQWLIANKVGKIQDSYEFESKPLGNGASGVVYKARLKGQTGEKAWRAIKKIQKKKKVRADFLNQVEILQKLDHPNVIKLFQTYEDEKYIYVVTQICTGGELFDMIIDKGCFSEDEARVIFKQMLVALNYCHSQKVAHRDLKPQNFMYLNKQRDSPLKLIDFGMSFPLNSEKKISSNKTLVGTSYYMAPQVLKGIYNQKCDVWSAGVILYILLTGEPPFNGQTDDVILEMVKQMRYTFNIPQMEHVSESAKDLIRSILVDSSLRPTTQQVLKHPWIRQVASQQPLTINLNRMKTYINFSRLKKIAIMMIATQINQHDITQLGKVFKSIDTKNDGVLTFDQIYKALDQQKQKFGILQIHKIIDLIDNENNKTINYTEFIASCMEHHIFQKQDYIKMAFKMIDSNEDGKITKQQLAELFSQPEYEMDEETILQIIEECDKNKDGWIDYNEFLAMMSED